MTITQFLALFPVVNETKKGWDVCCPAHADTHPSLGIMEGDEGRIVLNCFAGCAPIAICAALGLTLGDLFQDRPLHGRVAPVVQPMKPIPKRKLAFAYELHAVELRRAAQRILEVSGRCEECETWTDDEREQAMKIVNQAYVMLDRAQFCEDYADHLREVAYVAA